MKIKRGDIFWANLSPVIEKEIGGMRYVVVVSNDGIKDESFSNGGTVIVAPLSAKEIEGSQSSMAVISANIPELETFPYRVLLIGIRAINTERLKNHIGCLSDEAMAELDKKLRYVLGL